MSAKVFIKDFLNKYSEEVESVLIVALAKDGCIIDGWSEECCDRIATSLGMMEQLKLDFWDINFLKRSEMQ